MDKNNIDKYLAFLELSEEGQMPKDGRFEGTELKAPEQTSLKTFLNRILKPKKKSLFL